METRDAVIEEPGRRIVQEQTRTGGQALPWLDMTLPRGHRPCADNHANAPRSNTQWGVLRPWPDRRGGSTPGTGRLFTILDTIAQSHRYHSRIFLATPWPETAGTKNAVTAWMKRLNSERLQRTYPALGYAVSRLPKIRVAQRADFVLDTLASR